MNKFFETNIAKKSEFLQEEHKEVLQALYKNAIESNAVIEYEFNHPYVQAMKYTKLKEALDEMSQKTLIVCLHDLEQLGFILNVMINGYKEVEYAITYLGLKYIELNS